MKKGSISCADSWITKRKKLMRDKETEGEEQDERIKKKRN